MRAVFGILGICVLAVACESGCGRASPLRRTSAHLERGMTRAAVERLFSNYRVVLSGKEHRHPDEIGPIQRFEPDKPLDTFITYGPVWGKNFQGYMEECTVWFDVDSVLVAYQYRPLN